MQVSRSAAFSDACIQLLTAGATSLTAGPCTILPTFIEASALPGAAPTDVQQPTPESKNDSSAITASGIEPKTTWNSHQAVTGVSFAAVAGQGPAVASTDAAVASTTVASTDAEVESNIAAMTSEALTVAGKDAAMASQEVASRGLQEAGEGYGPRKEFFTLVATGMTCASGASRDRCHQETWQPVCQQQPVYH